MFRVKMKPDTIKRIRRRQLKERAERRLETRRRIRELANRDGPDSIWAEMLAEKA